METKEKMQALSQGSWQPLHAPIAPPICVSIPNHNPSSSPTPKGGKITMNGGEDPKRSVRASQNP